MAALSEADRKELWTQFMRIQRVIMSETGNSGLTKQALREVFDDLDDWLDNNKGAANAAIRQPQRGVATNSMKFQVLAVVATHRALRGA